MKVDYQVHVRVVNITSSQLASQLASLLPSQRPGQLPRQLPRQLQISRATCRRRLASGSYWHLIAIYVSITELNPSTDPPTGQLGAAQFAYSALRIGLDCSLDWDPIIEFFFLDAQPDSHTDTGTPPRGSIFKKIN